MPAVRTWGLCLQLTNRPILQDICLDVPPGATVALLGANGAGKSTLLRVLATLTPPSRGEMHLFGRAVGADPVQIRSRIGVIAHQPMLYRDLTVRENLEFFGKLYDVPDPARRAEEMLERVALVPRADDPVKTLSRGMTQRVAIARAMVHEPDLLLADEPFDGLDTPSAEALERLLGKLHDAGTTVIMANHNIAQSLGLADRAVVLRRGRIALAGPVADLTADAVLKEMSA